MVPERFGSYMLHEELGTGGMASVHLADWQAPGGVRRRVALKRLYDHIADVPELLAMFIDEARLARYLRHPNIAQVYEFGRISGTYFIAFEFVPGPTVQQLASQCDAHVGPIPIPVILDIACQICDALDRVRSMHIPPPSRFNPEVAPVLDDIVMTALQRDPAKRWQNATVMRTALENHARRLQPQPLTKAQLVQWVEWAFAQKQKLRE